MMKYNYTIKPLILSQVMTDTSVMTYLTYIGQKSVRPYVMWYIEGGEKKILVDTAIEAASYREYHPGFMDFPFEHVQSFRSALQSVNCTPEDIDIVIQTHLHFDHCMNTTKCINADVYVQEEELAFALDPHPIFSILYRKSLYEDLNLRVVKGDSTLLPGIDLLFVPGHSRGCQAVLIQTSSGKVAISGFCTIAENFYPPEDIQTTVTPFASAPVIIPGICTDPYQAYESILKVKSSADIIIPLHDYEMARKKQI